MSESKSTLYEGKHLAIVVSLSHKDLLKEVDNLIEKGYELVNVNLEKRRSANCYVAYLVYKSD